MGTPLANTNDVSAFSLSLSGDITGGPGTGTLSVTIAPGAITYAKMQQASPGTLLGNPLTVAGQLSEIKIGAGLALNPSTGVLSATTGTSGSAAPLLNSANVWSAAQINAPASLTYAATVTPDFSLANNFALTLTGNVTIANPLNQVAGQGGIIVITQDATGGRTASFGTNFKFAGGTAPVLSTGANAVDILSYYVISPGNIAINAQYNYASTVAPPPPPPPNIVSPAFYVSPTGSDSNPGTVNQPFKTLTKAQSAMRNSSTKTTYLRAGIYNITSQITLTTADNNESWLYYPPDGVNSAVLDGGGTTAVLWNYNSTSNWTLNGIKCQNFTNNVLIASTSTGHSTGVSILNCDLGFTSKVYSTGNATTAGMLCFDNVSVHIANNYLHDTSGPVMSIDAYNAGESIDGTVVENNFIERALTNGQVISDVGVIYINMTGTGVNGGHFTVKNNFIRNWGRSNATNDQVAIYLDNTCSNGTVTGNIVGPPVVGAINSGDSHAAAAFLLNGGSNNLVQNNIIDLGESGRLYVALMSANNTFQNNIVIANFAGAINTNPSATAYKNDPGPDTIKNSLYWNFGGGATPDTGNNGNDTNPTVSNPLFVAASYTYQLQAGSPAFSSPVNFTAIAGGWGPPGFVVPSSTNHSNP